MEEDKKARKGQGVKGGENQAGAGWPGALDEKPDPSSIWESRWILTPTKFYNGIYSSCSLNQWCTDQVHRTFI